MKELNTESKDKVVDERQAEINKEVKHEHSFMPQKGHHLWELNMNVPHDRKDGWHADVVKVDPKKDLVLQPEDQTLPGFATPLKSEATVKSAFEYKAGHIYCFALNKQNAIKRFEKKLNSLLNK